MEEIVEVNPQYRGGGRVRVRCAACNIWMLGGVRGELWFVQEGYSRAAMLIASEKHEEAEATLGEVMRGLRGLRGEGEEEWRSAMAECCVNTASCLLNRQDCEQRFLRVRELLEEAIALDALSHWAYFNLASYLYRTGSFGEALSNLHCCLSCLFLLKAVLSRDIENRNREIDLSRAIAYAENNLRARYVRLLMQVKQGRWKLAANEVDHAFEAGEGAQQLHQLRALLLSANPNSHLAESRSTMKRCLQLVGSIPQQRARLEGKQGSGDRGSVVKEIEDRMVEFNEVFRQVNELGSAQNLFLMKALHRTSRSEKRIHIISNAIQPSVQEEPRLTESTPFRPGSVELEAKTIDHVNDSKGGLTESKGYLTESKGYGESLFELTKSQNLENSKQFLPGSLLSSLPGPRPFTILPSEVREVENENETLSGSSAHKNLEIQAIESEIQQLPENESDLLSGLNGARPALHHFAEDDDLLLDSLYDRDFRKAKPAETPKAPRRQEEPASSLYPLGESTRTLQLTVVRAEVREEREKLVGIYVTLEYNSGLIETYKFRSRQVTAEAGSEIEWNESLGFIKVAEEPRGLQVKLFKSEPYYYNDKFLGEGEVEVTAVGVLKIPLYFNHRAAGTATVRLLPSEEGHGLTSSFKRSRASNSNLSSVKSDSQNSHTH